MARANWNDDWSDDEDDEPLDEDRPDDDASELTPCPECGAEIYEEAEQCPVCGAFISGSASLWSSRPWWWVVLGALGIVAATLAILFGS